MARLSEAPTVPAPSAPTTSTIPTEPPSIETLEAVKRNLIRQNRNLARANSTQSLQIRTLGAEVSRLLSVNLNLKEEVISLQNQLHNVQKDAHATGTGEFRRAMAAHLREMTAMLSSLQDGFDTAQSPPPSPETRKSMCFEEMEFRERTSLKEIMAPRRMPTIRENKTFPRQSVNQSPVVEVHPEHTESPELEPPVARVESLLQLQGVDSKQDTDTSDTVPDIANIETRRRRKLSSSGVMARRSSSFVLPLADKEPSTLLKTGAKRKLADRDSSLHDQNSRRSPSKPLHIFEEPDRPLNGVAVVRKPAKNVLAEKSTNFSPQKIRRIEGKSENKPDKHTKADPAAIPAKTPRARTATIKPVDAKPQLDAVPAGLGIELLPITPFPADVLSPLSSDKSLMDTPPPMDLSMRSGTGESEAARPSRRARAAVNYAEPSLVAKMRRPSHAMVDALTGLQDPRRAMNAGERRTSSIAGSESLQAGSDACEVPTEPTQPQIAADTSSRIEAHASKEDSQPARTSLGLSSMMAAGKAGRAATDEGLDLAIYDFEDTTSTSSPPAAIEETKVTQRVGRRHSSAAKATTSSDKRTVSISGASAASRRRSMMA